MIWAVLWLNLNNMQIPSDHHHDEFELRPHGEFPLIHLTLPFAGAEGIWMDS